MFTASMKFDLGEDVEAMREMVHRWAQERVKPMAADIDRNNEFPPELWDDRLLLVLIAFLIRRQISLLS